MSYNGFERKSKREFVQMPIQLNFKIFVFEIVVLDLFWLKTKNGSDKFGSYMFS